MSFEADSETDIQFKKLASQYSVPETSSVSREETNDFIGNKTENSTDSGVKGSADVTPKSYEDKLKDMGLKEL
jgi:hypothetical protein